MALDTRIALGVQPVQQQPNMLAQYAQVMGIKAAQQEMQGNDELRAAYAQGGDLSDPAFRRRVMAANPKLGSQLVNQFSEMSSRDVKTQADSLKTIKDSIGVVNSPAEMVTFLKGAYSTPGGALLTKLAPYETAVANIPQDPKSFEEYKRKFSLSADKLFNSADSLLSAQVSREGHGVQARGQDITQQNNLFNQRNPTQHFFTGEDSTLMGVSTRGGPASPVLMGGSNTQTTQPTMGVGSVGENGGTSTGARSSIFVNPTSNALAPTIQNSLVAQPAPAATAPTYAKVRAVPVTKDIVDPTDPSGKRMITVEVNSYKAGTGLGDGTQPVPVGVLGVANSQIQPNYMRDPNNPQGVIPVPGSAADPNANVPSGYRKTADGQGFEFIPGGPEDPAVKAQKTTDILSAKDKAAREAKYPQATTAVKGFVAKTAKFERDIDELIANEKGLNEITGFLAGRTDVSAMSGAGRRALALFNTITAKGGFAELQEMRNSSPTGGALGNVSDREGTQLINSIGALSRTQNANDLRKSLGMLKTDLSGAVQRVNEAYDLTYEYRGGGRGAPALPPGFKAD